MASSVTLVWNSSAESDIDGDLAHIFVARTTVLSACTWLCNCAILVLSVVRLLCSISKQTSHANTSQNTLGLKISMLSICP
jgi:hypothetical protein